jgi:hypothetical protein
MDRQARVGILRNLNQPTLPPPHRPPLMGRWMPLRSSRRPPQPDATGAGEVPVGPQVGWDRHQGDMFVRSGSDGIAGIDIAHLMASVEGMGQKAAPRESFGPRIAVAKPVLDRSWLQVQAQDPSSDDDLVAPADDTAFDPVGLKARLKHLLRRFTR